MENRHKKVGDFPTNARIKITYPEKGKPKIDFEYPDNERQIKGLWKSSGIGLPAMVLSIVTVILLFALYLISIPPNYPKDCEGTILTNNVTHETTGINLFCNNITRYYHIHYARTDFGWTWQTESKETDLMFLRVAVSTIALIILYFFFIYFYGRIFAYFIRKTNWGKNNYPGWNKRIHNKHWQAMFTECPDNKTIELPLFSNIYMDYEAEEEFADYLKEVEIKEHDIKYIKRRRFSRKKELVPNVYLWKAVFRFSKKPVKGFLKVEFT